MAFIMHQPRIVVPLVKIFQYAGEYLRLLIGQTDLLVMRFEELATAAGSKERRCPQHMFMRGE
jgi:hypothetical protein